jgi:hypothetical protein
MQGMKPGDVLTIGADQRPEFLAERTTSELRRNATATKKLSETLNLK